MSLDFPAFVDYGDITHTFRAMNHVVCIDPSEQINAQHFDMEDEEDQEKMQKMLNRLREKYVIGFPKQTMELGPIMGKMESLKPDILITTLQVFPEKGMHPANMIHIRVPLTYMETSICFAVEGVNLATGEKEHLNDGEAPGLVYILVLMDTMMYEMRNMFIEMVNKGEK